MTDEPMRRADRQLTEEETLRLFREAEYGVLSLIDKSGAPYGVPMSFALCDRVIYFHCSAAGGKKIACIRRFPFASASFTVVGSTKILPQEFATLYLSGIAFGTVAIVREDAEKRKGIEAILCKYSPAYLDEGKKYIDRAINKIFVLKLDIAKITGKGRKA